DKWAGQAWGTLRKGQFTQGWSLFDDIDSQLFFAGSDYAYGWRGVCVDGALEKGMTTARQVINSMRETTEQYMTQTPVYPAKIWAGVADDDWVEAFAVADGRIIATGALHEVEDQVGTPHETIIIDKGIVTPGLIDGHLHLSLGGTQLAHELALDPTDDAETILAKVREWTSRLKPGEWVIGGIIGSGVLPML